MNYELKEKGFNFSFKLKNTNTALTVHSLKIDIKYCHH